MKAILTGHTKGLGAAIAEDLLSRGIAVLGLARSRNEALAEAYPGLLEQVRLDLADTAALAGWLGDEGLQRFLGATGPVLLINNAGMLQPVGPVEAQDPSEIARTVSLNVAVPLMLTGAVAARAGRELRVLHVSSGAGRTAYAGWSVYCATKAALDHHARAVALDGTAGLRICSLAPGVIDTDMQAQIRATSASRFPLLDRFVALKQEGNLARPADAARKLVAYLLSAGFGDSPVEDLRNYAGDLAP
jgi:hypothetical protein